MEHDIYQVKEEINLNLLHKERMARVCKALSSETRLEIIQTLVDEPMTISQLAERFYMPMSSMCLHIKTLQDAGIIRLQPKPGTKGTSKLCGMVVADITINMYGHRYEKNQKPVKYVSMPIGNYGRCEVSPPCGIVSGSSYISTEDTPYGFYSPKRVEASLLWFTSGMLEYQFSTENLKEDVDYIEFSFEICSEAPGYSNIWPSDIDFELNHKKVMTIHSAGDYGGRRGINNPQWWPDSSTQYGEYVCIRVAHDGCFRENDKISEETMESLGLAGGPFFSFALKVDPESEHVGGMNLFGSQFGDYAQDILMKIVYK